MALHHSWLFPEFQCSLTSLLLFLFMANITKSLYQFRTNRPKIKKRKVCMKLYIGIYTLRTVLRSMHCFIRHARSTEFEAVKVLLLSGYFCFSSNKKWHAFFIPYPWDTNIIKRQKVGKWGCLASKPALGYLRLTLIMNVSQIFQLLYIIYAFWCLVILNNSLNVRLIHFLIVYFYVCLCRKQFVKSLRSRRLVSNL